jgi:hypothetical protein
MNEHLTNPFNVLYITFVSPKEEVEILVLISVLRVYMDYFAGPTDGKRNRKKYCSECV